MRVVGIDVGGTKTHIAIASGEGFDEDFDFEIVVPSNSWRGGLGDPFADAAGLYRLLSENASASLVSNPIAVGAHGCENTAQCRELARCLGAYVNGPVVVVNDAELMPLAVGAEGAIGVAVGTGSIATARTTSGELATAGGWGWILGDEGSAPGLVREAARAVLTELDRGQGPEALGLALMTSLSASNGAELALAVATIDSAETLGRHAWSIFEAAEMGSDLAKRVIREAGERLAELVLRLQHQGIHSNIVVAGGSVIEGQPALQAAFRAALTRQQPERVLKILDRAPVLGALALARRLRDRSFPNAH